MSIFRNRTMQRPQPLYEEDVDMEPRLFSHQPQRQDYFDDEPEEVQHRQSLHATPPQRQRRPSRVEDMNPRELSFWREERLYDDYDRQTRQASPLRFILVIASLAIIAVFAWLAFRWVSAPSDNQPRLIYSDQIPYKTHPDTPGGLEVPYKDRLIYNRLAPESQQKAPVERFLPPQEQPMALSQQPQQQAPVPPQQAPQGYAQAPDATMAPQQQQQPYYAQQPQQQQAYYQPPQAQQQVSVPQQAPYAPVSQEQQGVVGQQPSPSQQVAPQVPAPSYAPPVGQAPQTAPVQPQQSASPQIEAPVHTEKVSKTKIATVDDLIGEELKTAVPTKKGKVKTDKVEKVEKVEKSIPLSSKSYRVQVATLASEKSAVAELSRIRRSYTDLVGSSQSAVQKVEGESGVHRIIFGPFKTREKAVQSCSKFRNHGFSCIILNPAP